MAGIYLHIPFCKQACHYCDFHFSTSMRTKTEVINAMLREIELQKDYLEGEKIKTIYFGGGTPSILNEGEINSLIDKIGKFHDLSELGEVTLEANPDDLQKGKIQELAKTAINRLSIGIQSFFDDDLNYLNRAHNSEEALSSVKLAQDLGFTNITIDLIYGIPNSNLGKWASNLQKAFDLEVPHLSCYSLTIEEKTVFGNWLKKGKINVVEDDIVNEQFIYLMDSAQQEGFEHYEISNFAKPGSRAMHNSNYWNGSKYLGIGPGAHSFNGETRQFNIENNVQYSSLILQNEAWFDSEKLTRENKFNEYIMTSLRTKEGCNLNHLKSEFSIDLLNSNNTIKYLIDDGYVVVNNGFIQLTKNGKLLTDSISGKLFI